MSSEADVAWAAGVIDGEGCISIHYSGSERRPHQLYITLQVGMTCYPTLLRLQSILGVGTITERKDQTSRFWQMMMTHMSAETAIRKIYPYLFTKKRQARIALIFRSTTLSSHGDRRLTEEQKLLRVRCYTLIARAKKTRKPVKT